MQRFPPGLGLQHFVEVFKGPRECAEARLIKDCSIKQFFDLIHAPAAMINEWAPEHLRVLHCIRMDFWRRNIGLHNLGVPFGGISGGGRRRN
jgi:hypothetical protein